MRGCGTHTTTQKGLFETQKVNYEPWPAAKHGSAVATVASSNSSRQRYTASSAHQVAATEAKANLQLGVDRLIGVLAVIGTLDPFLTTVQPLPIDTRSARRRVSLLTQLPHLLTYGLTVLRVVAAVAAAAAAVGPSALWALRSCLRGASRYLPKTHKSKRSPVKDYGTRETQREIEEEAYTNTKRGKNKRQKKKFPPPSSSASAFSSASTQ
ncbi:hypothetical protein O1611_g9276 [Lasiodiplodia mahajangana]|uniref:Uncharacterized protein n=1 Tax=Lasiodiplodia mahajangana TaxID=1108764 RepID=A0ACC2JAF6_9PEZI|nr:hypothetical protein O1611_g9276 [Lasiodiplodia mahajangana]